MPTFSKLFFENYKNFFWGGVFWKVFFDVCLTGQSLRPLDLIEGGSFLKMIRQNDNIYQNESMIALYTMSIM